MAKQPELRNRELVFKKDEKVKSLTLSELGATKSLLDCTAKLPKSRPITHHAFIEQIGEMLTKNNLTHNLSDITVAKNESNLFPTEEKKWKNALRQWIFGQLIATFQIDSPHQAYNPAIAISYNSKGIDVAFGSNVAACRNMAIFGSDLCSTYGVKKMPYEKMIEVLTKWMGETEEKFIETNKVLDKMIQIELPIDKAVPELIGNLHVEAVKQAYINTSTLAPLNIGQVSDFTTRIVKHFDKESTISKMEIVQKGDELLERISLYDLYNIGTNILTHSPDNTKNKWERIQGFGNFMVEKFQLS